MDQVPPETPPPIEEAGKIPKYVWVSGIILLIIFVIGFGSFLVLRRTPIEVEPIDPSTVPETPKKVNIGSLAGAHSAFSFGVEIPAEWEVEVVPEIESINIYDPAGEGENTRERSQIFLRHFSANDFLTLQTVQIFSRQSTEVNGREAVVYDIEKLASAAPFPQQPDWRNQRHMVTDIRVSEANPSEFIVIARRPDVPQEVFDSVVNSIAFDTDAPANTSLREPAPGFSAAINLKPFGLYVTPANSPVDPEKFSGYHTAADAELPADTPVVSAADGIVIRSGFVSGYGGLVAIEHTLNNERVIGMYGHLDPDSLIPLGRSVVSGQQIGMLGEAFSDETDGERAHLHFGLYKGPGVDIRGYVPRKEDLALWLDPVVVLGTLQ